MKKVLLIVLAIGIYFNCYSQNHKACGHNEYMDYLEIQYPNFIEMSNATYQKCLFDIKKRTNSEQSVEVRSPKVVEVVFHVLYNTDEENLPDSIILGQLESLNIDFNRINADTINTRDIFKSIAGSLEIEFVLADTDPIGNPTNGINRVETNVETFFDDPFSMDFNKMKSSDTGGIEPWDTRKYINIWVCNMSISFGGMSFPGLLGFATPPLEIFNDQNMTQEDFMMIDGVTMHYQAIGPNNPNIGSLEGLNDLGRTLTHEMAHYFGVRHVWGDGDCSVDDFLDDTPPMADASSNLLGGGMGPPMPIANCEEAHVLDSCTDDMLPDLVENYLNYIDEKCMNMFTKQQAELMDYVLDSIRFDLWNESISSNSDLNISPVSDLFYPNPVEEHLIINSNYMPYEAVQIYNLRGEKVISNSNSEEKLDISKLSQGVYFILLRKTHSNYQSKLIKI